MWAVSFVRKKQVKILNRWINMISRRKNELAGEDEGDLMYSFQRAHEATSSAFGRISYGFFSLYVLEGYDHNEIAEILGIFVFNFGVAIE